LDKDTFVRGIGDEFLQLPLNAAQKMDSMILNACIDGEISVEEATACLGACSKMGAIRVIVLAREEKFHDALQWTDRLLKYEPEFLTDSDRVELKKHRVALLEEIEEVEKWELPRSDKEFWHFLFKRLAFKFHPDRAIHNREKVEHTKIMQEITRAHAAGDRETLKKIVEMHAKSWSKYVRHRT
jgi:hypothetical protein